MKTIHRLATLGLALGLAFSLVILFDAKKKINELEDYQIKQAYFNQYKLLWRYNDRAEISQLQNLVQDLQQRLAVQEKEKQERETND